MNMTLRVLAVPFDEYGSETPREYAAIKSEGLSLGDHKVVTSPSLHCVSVAKRLSPTCLLSGLLTVSGESTATDRYRRLGKTKLLKKHSEMSTLPGMEALAEKWWPASYSPWKTKQVPAFIQWLRRQTDSRNWVVVVTIEYAEELCKQLCTTPDTPPAAGEWRTYHLPVDGTSSGTFVPSESYILRTHNTETTQEWKARLEQYARVHFGLIDTPVHALWEKAKRELREYQKHVREERTRQAQHDKKKCKNKFLVDAMKCAECNADLYKWSLHDAASGDTFCSGCGLVITQHQMNDGAAFRTFEGEEDRNHNATSVNESMSIQTQLQTTHSKVSSRAPCSMGAGRCAQLYAWHKVDQMMLSNIESRTELTTQKTKDGHIRKASMAFQRLRNHPNTHVSMAVLKLAEHLFYYKRNNEVSLQPIGTSKTFRPRDSTLSQHQATSWMAAELYEKRCEQARPKRTYVPLTIVGAPSWNKKRGRDTIYGKDAAVALIPRQPKRLCPNIRPLNERAQALMAERTRRRQLQEAQPCT